MGKNQSKNPGVTSANQQVLNCLKGIKEVTDNRFILDFPSVALDFEEHLDQISCVEEGQH